MKQKLLFSLPAIASLVICSTAAPNKPPSGAFDRQVQTPAGQCQPVRSTKSFSDARDRISFSYPASYIVDHAAAARLKKQWAAARVSVPRSEKHPTAHLVALLTDKDTGAQIFVVVEDTPFDRETIRKWAPTGMDDLYWLRFTEFGNNKFYFYSGGNSAFQHPDQYFYNLNNKILSFTFDGPYPENSTLPDPTKAGPIEQTVLGSLRAPVKQILPIPQGAFLYTNEQYGFQLTLNPAWNGYRVSEQPDPSKGVTYLVFSVPANDAVNDHINLMCIGIQNAEVWEKRESKCGCGANSAFSLQFNDGVEVTAISRSRSNVFSLESRAYEDEVQNKYQLDQVVESFRLLP